MSAAPIPRLNAALEGRYRIESELGEGGMATVYLADDLRHERKVALKVLKPELAAVVGAERFLAEIKTTANLQHPHILPLFDSGEADSFLFYVMPYIEGESLRDKLDREKQLPVEEAVRLATDVAEALHAAHQQGVIHRDIKPANILLSQGRPLVADFGIALAVSAAGGGRLTETGLSVGTPYYMSPEQASADREPSAASDVYSLGCVLYEMLVGEPPHVGSSAQAVLAKILTEDVRPATRARPSIPAHVDAAMRRALEKLPADRFSGAQALADALSNPSFRHAATGGVDVGASGMASPWNRLSIVMTGIAIVASAIAIWALFRPTTEARPVVTRAVVEGLDLDRGGGGWRLAISPDGRWIVSEHWTGPSTRELVVRSAGDPTWRVLPDTDGARDPTFSPDGQWVAFSNGTGGLSKAPVTGGAVLPLTTSTVGSRHEHPHWALPDAIVFRAGGDILRVDASGGTPEVLIASDSLDFGWPHLLPSGDVVVYAAQEPLDVGTLRVMAFDLKTRSSRPILGGGVRPLFAPTGHLLYGDPDGALMAIGFDPRTLEVAGSPTTLITGVRVSGAATRSIRFAVSGTGTLVYDTGARGPTGRERRLVEVDLSGAERMLPVVGSSLHEPRYSPGDGRWIVYGDGSRISVYDGLSGSNPDFASGFEPKWSPDGAFIYFSVGSSGVQRRRADRSQDAEQLTEPGTVRYVTSVAPDGALATVREQSEDRGWDLRLMRLGPDGVELEDLLVADWDEYTADVSRDGRWVAYAATEEGEQRVYVRSFPEIGEKHAVSSGPGTQPLWAPDGTAIYYIDGARIMAVDVQTEPRFSASTPRLLFENPDYLTLDPDGRDHNWGIHPDGSRFVFAKDVGSAMGDEARAPTSPVYLVTNWFEELRQLTGGDQR